MSKHHKIKKAMLILGALTIAQTANAEYWAGDKLKVLVDVDYRNDAGNATSADSQKIGMLTGFVVGVNDAVDGYLVCSPKNGTVSQLVEVVKKYVRDNPDQLHKSASDLAISALSSAFPCK